MDDNATKVQKVILMIAKDVINICEEHNIEYSLDGGSLLGAVRHKGFIPWDDDFDLAIPRQQYDYFLKVAKRELSSKYFLQTEYNTRDYAFAFCKVLLNGTTLCENFSKTANVHHGIFIDIFPLDNLPDNKLMRKYYLLKNGILKNLIWVKCGYGKLTHQQRFSYKMYKLIGLPFSIENLKEKRRNLLKKCNSSGSTLCFAADYPKNLRKCTWYNSISKYNFENEKFNGVKNYDEYLTCMYGDYMKLPPENERRVHACKIDLGSYCK